MDFVLKHNKNKDTLAHTIGDNLIKNIGNVLSSVFSSEHVVSRTGGDEFVVIIKNKTSMEVKNFTVSFK